MYLEVFINIYLTPYIDNREYKILFLDYYILFNIKYPL